MNSNFCPLHLMSKWEAALSWKSDTAYKQINHPIDELPTNCFCRLSAHWSTSPLLYIRDESATEIVQEARLILYRACMSGQTGISFHEKKKIKPIRDDGTRFVFYFIFLLLFTFLFAPWIFFFFLDIREEIRNQPRFNFPIRRKLDDHESTISLV